MRAGRRVAISAGSLAVLLGALDTYVVVTIMRDIMNSVGIPINQLHRITWIVTMYLLGYIAAMPLLGRASDRFGRKLMLQVSLAGFIIGSVVTALAGHFGDFHMLIAGRTIQGVASGALLPITLALGAAVVGEPLIFNRDDRQLHRVGDLVRGHLEPALRVQPRDRVALRVDHRRYRRHLPLEQLGRAVGNDLRGTIGHQP